LAFALNCTLAQALSADFDLQTQIAWKTVIDAISAAMKNGETLLHSRDSAGFPGCQVQIKLFSFDMIDSRF
jgi:hypothetical protein